MKILVVDDDPTVLRTIKNTLERNKWMVAVATNSDQAKQHIAAQEFDVIICDYHLSDNDTEQQGLDLIREIRVQKIQTPVIFLTGRRIDEISPEDALNNGVDDFITKPWRPAELTARIKAVIRRRFTAEHNATNRIEHGDISMDIDLRKVFLKSEEIYLGNILFLILKKFLQKPGTLISYDDFIAYIWNRRSGAVSEAHKNTLRVHITHLKKALGSYAKHLNTIHGEGYIWEE